MTDASGNVGQFSRVDLAADSTWFIRFMDLANSLPEYGEIRRALAAAMGDLTGKVVLDVGCGTGDDARELARLVGAEGRVVGTDLSETMVREAERRSEAGEPLPTEFLLEDMCRLRFADGTFDATRAKLVRQHCEDIDKADDELVRVTRPGGRIVIFDYDFETLTVDHPDRDTTRELVRCWVDGHQHGWNGRELWRRFSDRGLRDLSVTPYTVRMPFDFFRASMEGGLAAARQAGDLALSADELAAWWRPLLDAAATGRFFASLTGFLLAGTR
ncbi:MAG: methyltransferase domain-containing protein [Actinomadura rubrobrunea]|nr:methyltransferase domain-containing protein [Actinomadura rubrobrunea]